IRRDAMNLTRCIYRANVSPDKSPHLMQLVDEFEFLKLEIRLCNDLRIIDTGSYAKLVLLMEDIGRQISGWRKSIIK
ncbi:four helix bundle protein, partial [uncultured Parabacteroides sp.]|uniref:four helix bundle protein n=1 Tax=uncultured Parabacteroides sp. TaxID=512312 RepID=UPI0025EF12EC